MGLMFEDRLENVVDPGNIGIGETVEIKTRMGAPVATGEVSASTPFGIALKEGGFYQRDIHFFIPVVEELPQSEAVNFVFSPPDEKVISKMKSSGQSVPMFEMDKISDIDGRDGKDGEGNSSDDRDDEKSDGGEKDPKDKNPGDRDKSSDGDSTIDVDQLPDDIKKAVTSSETLGEDDLNGVLGDIGDAAVKALKRFGADETELYDLAAKIQKAVRRILTTSESGKNKK